MLGTPAHRARRRAGPSPDRLLADSEPGTSEENDHGDQPVEIIAHDLSTEEKAIARRAVIAANAPSTDSAFLGAIRLIQMLKKAGVVIPAELTEPITTLDDWAVAVGGTKTIVVGSVKDDAHGRFPDGEVIRTSTISNPVRDLKEGAVITTRNSRYRLGTRAVQPNRMHHLLAAQAGCDVIAVAPVR